MKKAKVRKGEKLICVPCGRQVTVDCCGISQRTIWCCGKAMKKKTPTLLKKTKTKSAKNKK